MSEPDEPAEPPAPVVEDAPSAPDDGGRPMVSRTARLAILGVLGALMIVMVVFVVKSQRGRRASDAPAGSGEPGRGAIFAPASPQLPAPTGVRLTGIVVDGLGAPVIAAEVSVELEKGGADRALATTFADAGVVAGDAGAPAIHVSPVTGIDGRFTIEGLDPGRYRLRVTGPGLVAAEVRYVPVPSDETRIVVSRQVKIEGRVVDGTTPVANATVGLRGDAIGGTIEAKSDHAGKFTFAELPEGRYQLFAYQEALAARTVRVNRLGAGPFDPVELRLEAAAIVVGRVIDRGEGTGVVAAVELRPSGDDQAPRYARSGTDGVFRIEGVPTGRWIADAYAPGYASLGGVEIEAARGIPEIALSRGATIEGRVVDGQGTPIAGASVRALGSGQGGDEHSQIVDQDRLRRYSGRIAAAAPATSTASADPQFVERGELGVLLGPIPPIPPPGTQVARPASIDPSVATFVGEPPPLPVDPALASIWTTGADGRYRIRGLPKGKHAVLASAPGFAEGRSKRVTVELGQTIANVDITLSPGTILVGRVTDQRNATVVGAQVTAKPETGVALEMFTDADGNYRLGPVTGKVELSATAYGHGTAQKQLALAAVGGASPAEQREDLMLLVADAQIAGTLDDATGATVAGASIEVLGLARHAVAGADGTFAIDMVPAGRHRVRITHPDYPPVELDVVAANRGASARLRLPLGGAVEGALLDASSGSPLAGVAIAGDGPGDATADATSETSGRWKLGPLVPGRWTIAVQQPGHLPFTTSLDVPASRAPGEISVRDVRIELQRGGVIGGTVRDARGQRVANAKIVAQRADGTGPIATGTTDSAGEFRVPDAPTGELSIVATSGDASGTVKVTLRGGDEVLGLAIELGR